MNPEHSHDLAVALYNGEIHLRALVWCAFVMRRWSAIYDDIKLFESAIAEYVRARDAGGARGAITMQEDEISLISELRKTLSAPPASAEGWADIEASCRKVLARLGSGDLLPLPSTEEGASFQPESKSGA